MTGKVSDFESQVREAASKSENLLFNCASDIAARQNSAEDEN